MGKDVYKRQAIHLIGALYQRCLFPFRSKSACQGPVSYTHLANANAAKELVSKTPAVETTAINKLLPIALPVAASSNTSL